MEMKWDFCGFGMLHLVYLGGSCSLSSYWWFMDCKRYKYHTKRGMERDEQEHGPAFPP